MNRVFSQIFWSMALLFFSPVFAADYQRAGKVDVGGMFQWFSGDTVNASLYDRSGDLKLDDVYGGGLSFGYNINNYFNVNTEFIYSKADATFRTPAFDLDDDADFLTWTVNLDYYILPTAFTPFLSAGLGLLSLDNSYDDDWFYIYYYPPKRELPLSEVSFLWNVGAGLRWDVSDSLFFKLAYRLNGAELEYSSEQAILHSVFLVFGYSFSGR